MNSPTIAAIATPLGSGGIGIIKISGSKAITIAQKIFRSKDITQQDDTSKSRYLNYGYIIDPNSKKIIDEVLMVYMKEPFSYTREDVVEIQSHGSIFILRIIYSIILEQGANAAAPGEFTKRAFLNGRIDLTQAEAVIDLINAKTTHAVQSAAARMSGKFKKSINGMISILLQHLSEIEVELDFPEDVENLISYQKMKDNIETEIHQPIQKMIDKYINESHLKDGIKIVIAGSPNVGKSSLMNTLLSRNRVIVSDIPGTTRDIIEEGLNINGLPIRLSDTAGIHITTDTVEKIGIQKTMESIDKSDLILLVLDAVRMPDGETFFKEKEFLLHKKVIIVINKIDLVGKKNMRVALPKKWSCLPLKMISALNNIGIDELKNAISDLFQNAHATELDETIMPNFRQNELLKKCNGLIEHILKELESNSPCETLAIDISESITILNEIIGKSEKVDILDTIFSQFCIGK